MKKLLFISDKNFGDKHSFIDGVIKSNKKGGLQDFFDVDIVYFEKHRNLKDNIICIQRSDRKNALEVAMSLSGKKYDVVIVRNFYNTLKNALALRNKLKFKLIFQLSFPHFYRPSHQSLIEKKWVKSCFLWMKYKLNLFLLNSAISRCDGFLPISNLMVDEFFQNIQTPYLAMPMGVDEFYTPILKDNKSMRFIYIGAVDINRQLDVFFADFSRAKSDFVFDIFTFDYDYAASILPNDVRFKLHKGIDKIELFRLMREYDVGVFYVPLNRLYNLSSPTKVMDYCACGIVPFTSPVKECCELFDNKSAFFVGDDLASQVDSICTLSKNDLFDMSCMASKIVKENRSYEALGQKLATFLSRC